MSSLANVRSRIADDIARDDINSQIDKAINRAIIFYQRERFYFNEVVDATLTTVSGTQSYGTAESLPSDILELDVVSITTTGSYTYTLVPRTYQYIRDVNTSGTSYTGHPADWAWYASKLWLYPTPDAAYTITLSYMKSYAEMTLDADTNDFTTDAEDLIEARARWWICKRILSDREGAADAKEEELEALSALRSKTSNLLSTGKIRSTNF